MTKNKWATVNKLPPAERSKTLRRAILWELRGKELTIKQIMETTGFTREVIAKHLEVLFWQKKVSFKQHGNVKVWRIVGAKK